MIETYIGPDLRVRELPHAEYASLRVAPFYRDLPTPVQPSESARILVVEQRHESGAWEILGSWAAFMAVHVEPLVLGEDLRRRHPGVARALVTAMGKVLDEDRIGIAYAVICPAEAPMMERLIPRLGFTKLQGALWLLQRTLPPVEEEG